MLRTISHGVSGRRPDGVPVPEVATCAGTLSASLTPRGWHGKMLVLGLAALCAAAAVAAPVPVANGDFEAGLDGWTLYKPTGYGHGTSEAVSTDVHGGKQAVRMRTVPEGDKVLIGLANLKPIPLPDDARTFGITIWMKADKAPERVELRIAPTDREGKQLTPWNEQGWRFIRPAIEPHVGQWAAFNADFVARENWGGLLLTLWIGGGGADVLVDDISLEVQDPNKWMVAQTGARLPDPAPGVELWWEGPMRKVYPDDAPPQAKATGLQLDAAGDERQVVQLCLKPQQDLADVAVSFSDLRGPQALPASVLRANFVGLIDIQQVTSGHGRPGLTPDPLLPDQRLSLTAGQARSLWITLHVPRDTPAGDYTGAVTLSAGGAQTQIPLQVHVYGFNLPERPTMRTIARIWQKHEGYDDLFLQNLKDHRCAGSSYIGGFKTEVKDGEVVVDTSGLKAALDERLRKYGFEVFNVPAIFLGDASGLYNKEGKWMGFEVFTPEFDKAFGSYCRQVGDALRAEGVLEYALWQIWDEPHGEMLEKAKHLARLVMTAVPDAKVYMTTAAMDEFEGLVGIWCLPWPGTYTETAQRARKNGATLWAYDNSLYADDVADSSLLLRSFPWRLKRYGIMGVEWWAISQWKDDPWKVSNPYEPQNGGGFFIYPTPDRKGAPIDSIRWEMYREGVEDYDILSVLAEMQDEACQRLGIKDERLWGGMQALELARQVAQNTALVTKDPMAVAKAREEACRRIELLQGDAPVLFGGVRFPEIRVVLVAAGDARVKINGKAASGKLIERQLKADEPAVIEITRGGKSQRVTLN